MADYPITPQAVGRRVLRNITVSSILLVLVTACLADWQMTLGATLGGLLACINYRWMHNGLETILQLAANTGPLPRSYTIAAKFLLRWLLIFLTIFSVGKLFGQLSAIGIIIGLLTLMPSVVIEGIQQIYLLQKER
ncbi:MAG: ATP synthase subunit I [Acidobacteriota bacterium]|nr:ATP synthase subunit I [Blastocatellia bacterium]MDW8412386.1 ATP synthase subunit I [Acidobacteriota bacterium]